VKWREIQREDAIMLGTRKCQLFSFSFGINIRSFSPQQSLQVNFVVSIYGTALVGINEAAYKS